MSMPLHPRSHVHLVRILPALPFRLWGKPQDCAVLCSSYSLFVKPSLSSEGATKELRGVLLWSECPLLPSCEGPGLPVGAASQLPHRRRNNSPLQDCSNSLNSAIHQKVGAAHSEERTQLLLGPRPSMWKPLRDEPGAVGTVSGLFPMFWVKSGSKLFPGFKFLTQLSTDS